MKNIRRAMSTSFDNIVCSSECLNDELYLIFWLQLDDQSDCEASLGKSNRMEDSRRSLISGVRPRSYSVFPSNSDLRKKSVKVVIPIQLLMRKKLFNICKRICDIALFFAVLSLILMIISVELEYEEKPAIYFKTTVCLKSLISISTLVLVILVISYHVCDIKLKMVGERADEWYYFITNKRLVLMILEISVYCIHPLPFVSSRYWGTLDLILIFPMFLRLILIFRVMMLHNKVYNHASIKTLGALSNVSFKFKFMMKCLMKENPEYVLSILMTVVIVIASWMLRICERNTEDIHMSLYQSLWTISITFLSIGYGDIVPHSLCGRIVAVTTGLFGAGCTVLIIAVLANNLAFGHCEKYFNIFIKNLDLEKQYKNTAASIIKMSWQIYKNKKRGNVRNAKRYAKKLHHFMHEMRRIKRNRMNLNDDSVSIVEVNENCLSMNRRMDKIDEQFSMVLQQLDQNNSELRRLTSKLDNLNTLSSDD